MRRPVVINFAALPQPSIKRRFCLGPSLCRRYVGSAWWQLAVNEVIPANEFTKLSAAFSLHAKDRVAEPSGLAGRSRMGVKRKTMIVTGASKGIGAGGMEAFLNRGYHVVANSLRISK